jgi:hypothetical protein
MSEWMRYVISKKTEMILDSGLGRDTVPAGADGYTLSVIPGRCVAERIQSRGQRFWYGWKT